jgi:hypothetical protein
MTTEKQKEVSASPESVEGIASAVSAAQQKSATAEKQVEEQVQEQASVTGPTLNDIEQVFTKYQGTQNNWNATRMKQIEDNLTAKVDEALQPFKQVVSSMEQARVEQLDEAQQVEYWRAKAQQAPAEPLQQQQQQSQTLLPEEQLQLANGVSQMIADAGLQTTHLDPKIWDGALAGMTVEQFNTVAQNNINKLKQSAPVATPTPPPIPVTPPPTTQEAPSRTTSPIETKSEAVESFQRGDINIDEYRRIGTEKGWMRGI